LGKLKLGSAVELTRPVDSRGRTGIKDAASELATGTGRWTEGIVVGTMVITVG
jgi:hypothetical protein